VLAVSFALSELTTKFINACSTPSDINEHLPTILRIASKCESIIEFGVRFGLSSTALITARPKSLISYDLALTEEALEIFKIGKENGVNCTLQEKNTHEVEIPPVDFLFIDSDHTYKCLSTELRLHGDKPLKFLAFHDTVSYAHELVPAIREFLETHPNWIVYEEYTHNNGFLILSRIH